MKTSSRLQINKSQLSHQPPSAPKTDGFFSTLLTYITSAPRKTNSSSRAGAVSRNRKIIETWNDVDLTNLNAILVNCLYNENLTNQNLLIEIEKIVGRPREMCVYSVLVLFLALVFLHEPIGSITVFLTLIVPGIITALALLSDTVEGSAMKEEQQYFCLRYWLVYSAVVAIESFFSSLIQWDLRIFRLVTLGMCLTSRVPVLNLLFDKIMLYMIYIRNVFEENNHEIDHKIVNL